MHPPCDRKGDSRCGSNDLIYLAYRGCSRCVQRIVRKRLIDINTRSEDGWTPLMLTTQGRHLNTARILIEGGAAVSAVNESRKGITALHISTRNNDIAVTVLLVESGASVEAVAAGCTPLQLASDLGHLHVTRVLIGAGANLDRRRTTDGATAIFLSANAGHLEAVRLLLLSNASPLIANHARHTPLDAAAGNGHMDIVRELVEVAGIKEFGSSLRLAAHNDHLGIMHVLYSSGARDYDGRALRDAIMYGGGEAAVRFLLQRPEPLVPLGPTVPYTSTESRYVNYKPSSSVNSIPPLLCCLSVPRANSHRVLRMLLDAGACTTFPITIVGENGQDLSETSPLGMTTRVVQYKLFNGVGFTDQSMPWVENMRRMLLCVEAIRAVSWGWGAAAPPAPPVARTTSLALLAPMRKEKAAKKTRVVPRALFRYIVKQDGTFQGYGERNGEEMGC